MIWRFEGRRGEEEEGGWEQFGNLAAAVSSDSDSNSGDSNSARRGEAEREKRSGNWPFWMAVLGLGYRDGSTLSAL